MNVNKDYLKRAGIVAAFILGFWVLAMWYFSPALDGKMLQQGDMQQVRMMTAHAKEIKAETGAYPHWSDRLFSGMPSNLITGVEQGSLLLKWKPLQIFNLVKHPFDFLFLSMLSTFILLVVMKVDKVWAAAGAVGYAFMTFTLSSFEAGHITKVQAMALLPGVIAGLMLLSREKWVQGGLILAVFFGMMINFFHYQIAYYAGFIMGAFAIVAAIKASQEKKWKSFLMQMGIMVLASVLGVVTAVGKIYDTMQYSKATMRGGSEVTSEIPEKGQKTVGANGLDIDYAFSWSYGISETFTLFVPRFKGGSSNEAVPENEFGADRLPMYFGEMQFTSGPVYMGAILMFFFILGEVFAWNWRKWRPQDPSQREFSYVTWFSLLTFGISVLLAWGKYLPINEWLFNVLPYYNKFRTPMMALSIAQAIVPFYAIYAVYKMVTFDYSDQERKAMIKASGITLASILGVIMVMAGGQSMSSPMDAQIGGAQSQQVMPIIMGLRKTLLWNDVWRSAIFMILAFGVVYGVMKQQLKVMHAGIILTLLVAVDLIGVSNRYLSEEQWVDKEEEEEILPSKVDEQVMADNKDQARVFDLRYSPFNDNHSAPFHRNVGGYHPAKLSRYQDIISFGITKAGSQLNGETIMNNPVLDMLNCKYVLSKSERGEEVIMRSTSYGNAWLVGELKFYSGAKEALNALQVEDLRIVAVMEGQAELAKIAKDSSDFVKMVSYSSDSVRYKSSTKGDGFAVFSEVYYAEKNGAWKVYVDGKPAKAERANYILRGVSVPAGAHDILWVYEPADRSLMVAAETGSSAALILGLLVMIALPLFKKDE